MSATPLHICYGAAAAAKLEAFAGPGVLFVIDFNALAVPGAWAAVQRARDAGSTVLEYLRPISRLNNTSNVAELDFYMGALANVPLWGGGRRNNVNSMLIDIRVGGVWAQNLAEQVGKRAAAKRSDGVFLDVLGARPWGVTLDWDNWPASERAEWTAGAVDTARLSHVARMSANERFLIIHNNTWELKNDPSTLIARQGEGYCNGVCIEHHPAVVNGQPSFHANYVGHRFSPLPKRNLILAMDAADAAAWANVPGATHVCAQTNYGVMIPPVVPLRDTRLDDEREWGEVYKTRVSEAVFDVARARGERDAAIEQRVTVQGMFDAAAAERDEALAQRESAVLHLDAALGREAAAADAAYRLQLKINSIRSIVS